MAGTSAKKIMPRKPQKCVGQLPPGGRYGTPTWDSREGQSHNHILSKNESPQVKGRHLQKGQAAKLYSNLQDCVCGKRWMIVVLT